MIKFLDKLFGYSYVSQVPKKGDRSEDVKVLQKALNNKAVGATDKKYIPLVEDGIWGFKTSEAIINFKKSVGYYASDVLAPYILDHLYIKVSDIETEIERDNITPPIEDTAPDDELQIVYVDTVWQTKGAFRTKSKKPSGLCIHYTVSGNSKQHAINVAKYFSTTPKVLGYQVACPIMDKDGIIYIPKTWDIFGDWHNNIGPSKHGNLSGLSQYFLGLEICSWGRLDDQPNRGVPENEKRTVAKKDNMAQGTYQIFTKAQEKALVLLIKKMLKECPEFKIENIVGHDSCATPQGRKQDPGGSLSRTIPEFRAYVYDLLYREGLIK